jgi:hypothetical protein
VEIDSGCALDRRTVVDEQTGCCEGTFQNQAGNGRGEESRDAEIPRTEPHLLCRAYKCSVQRSGGGVLLLMAGKVLRSGGDDAMQ